MADDESMDPIPPYASFTTIRNLIERMEKQGVPARVDPSYLVGMAGGTQNQVRHALRSLALTEEDGTVTSTLSRLVKHPEDRPKIMANLLRERYPRLTELDQSATRGQLDDVLRSYGLNGATARKAASFFIAAARYAELSLSPHFPAARPGSGGTSGTRKRSATKLKAKAEPKVDQAAMHSSGSEFSTGVQIKAGRVSLVVDVNPIKLRGEDRDFVYGLIDSIEEYAARTQDPPTANGAASDAEQTEESAS